MSDTSDVLLRGIRADLEEIRAAVQAPALYTIADIARRTGMSAPCLRDTTRPWRLPNFGKPDWGDGTRRWLRASVEAWYARTEDSHRHDWEAMPPAKRRAHLLGLEGKKAL